MSLTNTITEYRERLSAGHKFFIRKEGRENIYRLVEKRSCPGLFYSEVNDQLVPDFYLFIEERNIHRVYTGSGIAVTHNLFFSEIQFVN